jgi:D-lyxose ketol-isomerase
MRIAFRDFDEGGKAVKRSEINAAIRRAIELLEANRWSLPPFAHWTAEDYAKAGAAARFLREHQMGWDVTDFGAGDFARRGLTLFCVRNGVQSDPNGKPYAEKLLFVGEGQETPTHRHRVKMEDIINRAGGVLVIEFAHADADGKPTDAPVTVRVDGVARTLKPWEKLRLTPGESVTVDRGVYHRFYGEVGKGVVLAGEVSQVNDDHTDNYFLERVGRFAAIEEDEPPLRRLWNEAAA